MEISPTTVILVGVICVGLGFLASVLLNTLAEDSGEPPASGDETPPGGKKGRYTPVVRIWRERGAGTLIVEMDGKSMVAPDPLTDVQRERLERSISDLRAWLANRPVSTEPGSQELPEALPASSAVPPEPAAPSQANLDPFEDDLSRAIRPIPAPPPQTSFPASAQTYATPPEPRSARPSSAAPVPPAAAKGKEDASKAAAVKGVKPKSMVMQIEDILQEMIADTPMGQKGIHLLEDPVRGVIVQVGLDHYEGIASVPDPEVKALLQSAVQKWEIGQ